MNLRLLNCLPLYEGTAYILLKKHVYTDYKRNHHLNSISPGPPPTPFSTLMRGNNCLTATNFVAADCAPVRYTRGSLALIPDAIRLEGQIGKPNERALSPEFA
jgi:hypothetical protein